MFTVTETALPCGLGGRIVASRLSVHPVFDFLGESPNLVETQRGQE